MRSLFLVPFVLSVASILSAAETVKQKINLFDVIKSGDVEFNVNPKMEMHEIGRAHV